MLIMSPSHTTFFSWVNVPLKFILWVIRACNLLIIQTHTFIVRPHLFTLVRGTSELLGLWGSVKYSSGVRAVCT
jgi:hypothetical protein